MLVAAIVLLLPGVPGVIGILPRVAPAPEALDIGGVVVSGDIGGCFSLVSLLVALGWKVTVLAADSLRFHNKFWDGYDHV